VVDSGLNQTGATGEVLPLPFIAVVVDAGKNRLAGVPVTFTVTGGGGTLSGTEAQLNSGAAAILSSARDGRPLRTAPATPKDSGSPSNSVTMVTDGDGRAAAFLHLGTVEGQGNQVVTATFAGNPGSPAMFVASGLVAGNPAQTSVTGVVLDNSNVPIPGVTMRLLALSQGTTGNVPVEVVPTVQTDSQGQFTITQVPVGVFKLMADGSTVLAAKQYPTLEFDVTTVAGRATTVGMPIYLQSLDTVNQLCVGDTTGGTLTLPAVPGFALTVAPGSATFPGGSLYGCITATPVNMDKVPMAPGFGQQPRFIVTIQPVGTAFNPPAALTLPNVEGLAPREITEMYSYDHDLAAFVAIGTGTVSVDGSTIVSDPGVGVLKAGWHCGGDPTIAGVVADCPVCKWCMGALQCVTDPGQAGHTCSPGKVCFRGNCAPSCGVPGDPASATSCAECKACDAATHTCVTGPNGSDQRDQNSCCFNGDKVNKYGQTPGYFSAGPLETQCPQRTQNTNRSYESDGCTSVPQDPMRTGPMIDGPLNVPGTSTAFGQNIGVLPNSAAAGPLPCNLHDICYQTCAAPGMDLGAAKATCDNNFRSRMNQVCTTAYPAACPAAYSRVQCLAYFIQQSDCYRFATTYYNGVSALGYVSAYRGRQRDYCQCCQ
jgi:hypothetical protein